MLPVLAPLQEVLVPTVVGEVVEYPGTICHHTGVGLAHLVGIINRWAVIRALHHLPTKVRPLVQPQLPRTTVDLQTQAKHSILGADLQRFHFMASVMKSPGKFLPKIKNTCAEFHSRLSAHMGLHFYYVISSKAGLWLLLHCQLDWFKAQTD